MFYRDLARVRPVRKGALQHRVPGFQRGVTWMSCLLFLAKSKGVNEMKINITTEELGAMLTSGNMPDEAKKTIAGAIIEVVLSDEANQAVIAMAMQKAEAKMDEILRAALYVKAAAYHQPAEIHGYLANELTTRLKQETCLSAQSIMASAAEKVAGEQLKYMVEREVDREVSRYVDAIVKGEINKVFIEKISDEFLESAVNRVIRKRFEK